MADTIDFSGEISKSFKDNDVKNKLNLLKENLAENYGELELPPNFDNFLLRCLRVRKYDVVRSATLVSQYFKFLGELSDIHHYLKPTLYENLYVKDLALTVLKHRDEQGRAVVLARQELVPPDIYSFDAGLSAFLLLLDEVVNCSGKTQETGVVCVCDMKSYSLAHFRQATPSRLRTAAKMFKGSFPANFKALHMVNNPFLFSCLYAIVKPFLPEKIRSRIHFHADDFASLHQHVSPSILPEFLGGVLPNDQSGWSDNSVSTGLIGRDGYYSELLEKSLKYKNGILKK